MTTSSPRNLQLGCFDQALPGWVNTDVTPHIYVSRIPGAAMLLFAAGRMSRERYEQHRHGVFRDLRYLNVTKSFPFSDDTFDHVYSSHLLEHLCPDEAGFCLSETYRVLRPGGIVRIVVPDLDRLVTSYDPGHPEVFLEGIFEATQRREKNRHHWHYNEVSLARVLRKAGFCETARYQFQQGHCANIDLLDQRPESLFMEAYK